MNSSPKKESRKRKIESNVRLTTNVASKTNVKRSRLMKKSDEELLFEVLVLAEKVGSFCPEKLLKVRRIKIFEEAYRRFGTWNDIVERCVDLANEQNLVGQRLKPPKEVVLEILRLETAEESLQETSVRMDHAELHAAVVMYYGSWDCVLAIVGAKEHDPILGSTKNDGHDRKSIENT